jgi:hypothetical protein
MAAPLNTCTTIEQRGVVRFLWAKNTDAAKDIHKEVLPTWAAFLCGCPLLPFHRNEVYTSTHISTYQFYTFLSEESSPACRMQLAHSKGKTECGAELLH